MLFFANQSFAYQTVAMEFNGNWYKARYLSNDSDAIVQYLKQGQTLKNWDESIVFHTFKWSKGQDMSAQGLMQYLIRDVRRKYPNMKVEYITVYPEDTVSSWCVEAINNLPAQCEILRTTQSFEGALSIHYINKNPKDFLYVKQDWLNKIRKARIYQSYFRQDRILNKALTFEL